MSGERRRQSTTPLESVLRRDRALVLVGISGVALLSWLYLFYLIWARGPGRDAGSMTMGSMTMGMDLARSQVHAWGTVDFALMLAMWVVMMAAMMVPTAAPMLLTFAAVNRQRRERERPYVATGVFLLGYLLVWSGFAAAATLAQCGLNATALLTPMLASASPWLGGGLLLAAGLFQWSPLKYACLNHCRSPLSYIIGGWREGGGGALVMGMQHGAYCLGCCWALMGLLLVLGVMNLLWIAALAGFVLVEKVAPGGHWIGRVTGLLLVVWGLWLVVGALL